MPYQGSKSGIAEWVVSCLPPGDVFVDLFCGGCAVTHAALALHKYRRAIINDMNPMMPRAFADAIAGKFHDDYRWISREDFFRLKDTDAMAAICFSFGNHLTTYCYGPDKEPMKRAFHYAVCFDDWAPMGELQPDLMPVVRRAVKSLGKASVHDRRVCFGATIRKVAGKRPPELESLERLQSLESLQSLQSLERLIEFHTGDYRDVVIPPGAVVYCDPPYCNTKQYKAVGTFDHAAFYDWLLSRHYPVFVSEYTMPDDFAPIAIKQKTGTMAAKSVNYVAEKIFVQRRYADKFKRDLFL